MRRRGLDRTLCRSDVVGVVVAVVVFVVVIVLFVLVEEGEDAAWTESFVGRLLLLLLLLSLVSSSSVLSMLEENTRQDVVFTASYVDQSLPLFSLS